MMHQVFVVYPIRISEGDLGPWQDTIKVYVPFIENLMPLKYQCIYLSLFWIRLANFLPS